MMAAWHPWSPCQPVRVVCWWIDVGPVRSQIPGGLAGPRAQLHDMQPSCQSRCDASDAAYAGLWHLKPCAVKRICISNTGEAFFPFCPGGCVPCGALGPLSACNVGQSQSVAAPWQRPACMHVSPPLRRGTESRHPSRLRTSHPRHPGGQSARIASFCYAY